MIKKCCAVIIKTVTKDEYETMITIELPTERNIKNSDIAKCIKNRDYLECDARSIICDKIESFVILG